MYSEPVPWILGTSPGVLSSRGHRRPQESLRNMRCGVAPPSPSPHLPGTGMPAGGSGGASGSNVYRLMQPEGRDLSSARAEPSLFVGSQTSRGTAGDTTSLSSLAQTPHKYLFPSPLAKSKQTECPLSSQLLVASVHTDTTV